MEDKSPQLHDSADQQESMFPLLRNFVLVGLATIVIVTAVLGSLIHRAAVNNLVEVGEDKNIALGRMLSHDLAEVFTEGKQAASSSYQDNSSTEYQALSSVINGNTRGTSIIKVRLFDSEGLILFSTDPGELGDSKNNGASIERALNGQVVTRLAYRDKIHASEELLTDIRILSSYIPLYMHDHNQSSPVTGIIEIDADVSGLYQQTFSTRNKVIALTVVAMLLIFTILFIYMRRADSITGGFLQEKLQSEQRMRHIAYHDSLTGLANREMFRMRLQAAMARAERTETLLAVLFLDLDKFKFINDTLGHNAGDQLLIEVTQRLQNCVRLTDTVGRQGGDEFTVILDAITHVEEVEAVTCRIRDALREPYDLNGRTCNTSASIGITIYPMDDRDIDHLLKNADAAMYAAKESGRDNYVFFTAEMNNSNQQKLEMERRLRTALEQNEYLLQFQPIVDINKGTMMGVEALLRWNNSEYGPVSPAQFIPILEETGFISIVGEWVLQTACCKAAEWQHQGHAPVVISVNISIIQFRRLQFVDSVRKALEASGLDPQYLKLEITESILMDQSDACVKKLEAIRALGVSIAADDFGTGYSSLSYLKKLPIDILKIDRSFVSDVHKSSDSAAIVTAIAALAHSLKLGIIAEGVEQLEELSFLSALRCNYIQGYFFSKPLAEEALLEIMGNSHYFIDKLHAAREMNQAASG